VLTLRPSWSGCQQLVDSGEWQGRLLGMTAAGKMAADKDGCWEGRLLGRTLAGKDSCWKESFEGELLRRTPVRQDACWKDSCWEGQLLGRKDCCCWEGLGGLFFFSLPA